jgi:hypothetical protein
MTKSSIADLLFLLLISILIFGIGIAIFILPHQSFSERENRELATLPDFDAVAFIKGEFFDELSNFYSDQLPFRATLGAVYSLSEISLGKCESNRIILAKNKTLVARNDFDEEIYNYNLQAVNLFLKNHKNSILFSPPDSIEVFWGNLPPVINQSVQDLPSVNKISENYLALVNANPSAYYYYRTDHHWTSRGAYEAYRMICEELGETAFDEDFFDITTVSNNFFGSSFRRSALPHALVSPDQINLYRYEADDQITVTDHYRDGEQRGLYSLHSLASGDQYTVFLGGNDPYLSVTKKSNSPRRKMLLIKDSFANSLIPFLALHYDIEMIDPRYIQPSNAADLIELDKFDAVLMLCSKNTLATERSFGRLLEYINKKTPT